ncbi:MAG: AAA family ATPase [Desulfobulbaceae bacterium]|nr:AAA family ATPase [Desulfobulbaceae bacterium]
MKLHLLRICNFQSFGPEVTEIDLEAMTYLIGPNGSGKTAVLQALSRLFAFDPGLRRIQRSDFHVLLDETEETVPDERFFWIEAEFKFPELAEDEEEHTTIPPHFGHMRLDTADGVPRVRFRLDATMDLDGEIDDILNYVLEVDDENKPLNMKQVSRADRNNIHVHYLPARRDPSNQISYTANSLLGRALRSVNWKNERDSIKILTEKISGDLCGNKGVETLDEQLSISWKKLHKGLFFKDPQLTFIGNEIEALLRHLSVSFTPGHGEPFVDFSRLSDGQKSMLYLSLVLANHDIGRSVLSGDMEAFDVEKLRPAIFTLIAMEEPENSLSPHYLGRIVQSLTELAQKNDAQALIATHAPSMLIRVLPEHIRYLRLNKKRQTQVTRIVMPPKTDEAYKFVREAVQAFPELYFARLVILGEGDSEEIVLPRLLKARGLVTDEAAISITPLGGRHVNHFWRLLSALDIPYLTLLDLDLARYQGGWGRVRYVSNQLMKFSSTTCGIEQNHIDSIPAWDGHHKILEQDPTAGWLNFLENHCVFYSSPLDLDFAMLKSYPAAYNLDPTDLADPDESNIKAVLGKSYNGIEQYTEDEKKLFITYHKRFKLSSKPAEHLNALATLDDAELVANIPASLNRLIDAVIEKLKEMPE